MPPWQRFWGTLAKECKGLHYVRLSATCTRRDRRSDARALWNGYTENASLPFLRALVFDIPGDFGSEILAINVRDKLKPVLAQAERAHGRRNDLISDWSA